MKWAQLTLCVPADQRERALNVLTELGFPSIVVYVGEDGDTVIRESHLGILPRGGTTREG